MMLKKNIERRDAIAAVTGAALAAASISPDVAHASEDEFQAPEIAFLYLDELTLPIGQEQHFVVSLNESADYSGSTLSVLDIESNEELCFEMTSCSDNSLLFSFDTGYEGSFTVSSCHLAGLGSMCDIDFTDVDRSCRSFSVIDGLVSDSTVDDSITTDVYTLDGSDVPVELDSVEEGLSAANDATPVGVSSVSTYNLTSRSSSDAPRPFVVGIDPGHSVGTGNSGAVGVNGAWESSCTWKIACYCRAELETYSNVKVVFSKDYDTDPELDERVQNLVSAGAQVVVSIHLNSTTGGSNGLVHGAEVWVPYSTDYNYETHVVGEELGKQILSELAKLGLSDRGTKVKTADGDQYRYEDGSNGDYYGIIRYARKAGIPGIIVEHAFIDNQSDYYNFLNDDSKLKKLGVADAEGIASTYGLSQGDDKSVPLYRLYNPNDGEHLYTLSMNERDVLSSIGWVYEGIAWRAPLSSSTAVYRLYNPNSGDHHYTTSQNEYDTLGRIGWKQEGTAWYSAGTGGIPLYRLFNPNVYIGTHHYTTSENERDVLSGLGWIYEGVAWYGVGDDGNGADERTPIMSRSSLNSTVLSSHFKNQSGGHVYPSDVYEKYGAKTVDSFCQILCEEAFDEGVSPAVVYAQAMLETGYLTFGGDAKAEQCNFCGLGVTGGGNSGLSFNSYGTDSVRMGLRAQVQHLKAYASTDNLVHDCVDPRFRYVNRGCAPYVEDLGNGKWASDPNYASKILGILNELGTA